MICRATARAALSGVTRNFLSNLLRSSRWTTWICLGIVIKTFIRHPNGDIVERATASRDRFRHAIAVRPGEQAELELKLLAPQGTLEKLREASVIVMHARNRGGFTGWKRYTTIRRSGCSSSMACAACATQRQTLHSDTETSAQYRQPQTRRQWEAPVDGATPDLARLPADEVGGPMTTLTNGALLPVFATKVRRHAAATRPARCLG